MLVFFLSQGEKKATLSSSVWTFLNKQREYKPSKNPMENYVEITASSSYNHHIHVFKKHFRVGEKTMFILYS